MAVPGVIYSLALVVLLTTITSVSTGVRGEDVKYHKTFFEKSQIPIGGVIAAVVTPLQSADALKLAPEKVVPLFHSLYGNNITNYFVAGTTGESEKLTPEERMILAEAWINATSSTPEVNVIIHVGAESLNDVIMLAQHAVAIGADAVALMAPSYFKPATISSLVSWVSVACAAAPSLPCFYYHIPVMNDVSLDMYQFLGAVRQLQQEQGKMLNFAGLKFTDFDLYTFARCVHFGAINTTNHGPFKMFYGHDEALLGALAMQGDGAVGSTYNFMGQVAKRMFAAFDGTATGLETARIEQARIAAVVDIMNQFGGIPTTKAILGMIGVDVGPPRLPDVPLSAAQVNQVKKQLMDIGFFSWYQ